jgi:hypothetical protein
MNNFEIKNLQINFNQVEDALTLPAESRHDHKCGIATQSGRSMIEMLGVLAIIGVLSVGGIAGYSKAMMKYRINKTIEQITLIAGNVRAFWGPQKNYGGAYCHCYNGRCDGSSIGDGCPIAKKAKIIPDEMLTIDSSGKITAITGAFGLNVYLESYGNDNFRMTYEIGANEEACIELVSHDWTPINVERLTTYPLQGDGSKLTIFNEFPVSIDSAAIACDKAIVAGRDGVYLNFTFH